jgi:hypothetical protein
MGMDDGDEKGDAMDVDAGGAAAGGAASSAAQAGGAPGGDDVPAAAIDALTGMGFSREQAIAALRRYPCPSQLLHRSAQVVADRLC